MKRARIHASRGGQPIRVTAYELKPTGRAQVLNAITVRPSRDLVKWCACALALLMPGSFVVLPLFLLGRHLASWANQPNALPSARP